MDFAMGIEGTQIAKDAANIILLNGTSPALSLWPSGGGTCSIQCKDFRSSKLTVSTAILLLNAICACIGVLCLLTGLHLLWLSLILDSVDSVALASDPPTDELLEVSLQHLFCEGA